MPPFCCFFLYVPFSFVITGTYPIENVVGTGGGSDNIKKSGNKSSAKGCPVLKPQGVSHSKISV